MQMRTGKMANYEQNIKYVELLWLQEPHAGREKKIIAV